MRLLRDETAPSPFRCNLRFRRSTTCAVCGWFDNEAHDHILDPNRIKLTVQAAEAIAAIAPESAEARLLPMLRDEHGLVRSSAIESLAMLPTASPQLLDALIAALDDSERIFGRNVRSAAAVALGKFAEDGSPALSRLKRLVKQEENERVKKAAEDAVRQITQGG